MGIDHSKNQTFVPISSEVDAECKSNEDSSLPYLPEEIKLKILSYLDYRTVRFVVSLLNKDFNRISKDSSFYKRYVCVQNPFRTSRFETEADRIRANVELSDPLFIENLTELIVSAKVLNRRCLKNLKNLQKLTVYHDLWDKWDSTLGKDNWALKEVNVCGATKIGEIECNTRFVSFKVECVWIDRLADFERMNLMPAEQYMINPQNHKISLEAIQMKLRQTGIQDSS